MAIRCIEMKHKTLNHLTLEPCDVDADRKLTRVFH